MLFFVSRTHRATTVLLEGLFSKQLHADAILGRNVGPGCFCPLFTTVSLDPESHILDQHVVSRRQIARCEKCLFFLTFCTTILTSYLNLKNPIHQNPILSRRIRHAWIRSLGSGASSSRVGNPIPHVTLGSEASAWRTSLIQVSARGVSDVKAQILAQLVFRL